MQSSKILIVEDFANFRRFICMLLQQRAEFQIMEVSDGLEAVKLADEMRPDLLLVDIGLPGLNGLEVARRVRELAPAAKILFLSQECSPDVVREALSVGTGYVHKSCAQTDLLPAIEAVLEGKRFVSASLELSEGEDAAQQ